MIPGDESTPALDPVSISIIEDLFYTIILVTHILRQGRRVSDYIIFVYMGKIIGFGPTEELLLNPFHRF